jgi:hypothetical protein
LRTRKRPHVTCSAGCLDVDSFIWSPWSSFAPHETKGILRIQAFLFKDQDARMSVPFPSADSMAKAPSKSPILSLMLASPSLRRVLFLALRYAQFGHLSLPDRAFSGHAAFFFERFNEGPDLIPPQRFFDKEAVGPALRGSLSVFRLIITRQNSNMNVR